MDKSDAFLAHYGVLGMHWGQRKSEDEIARERSAQREKRAGKFDKKAADYQKSIDKLNKETPRSNFQARSLEEDKADLAELKKRALADAQAKRNGKLSEGERKVVIGAAVVGGLLAARFTHGKIQSGQFIRLATKGKAFVSKTPGLPFTKNPKLAEKGLSSAELHARVVKHVNPKYGAIGTKMNCRRCTFTYEMRRRGYDVQATRTTNASGQNPVGFRNALSPGQKVYATDTNKVVFNYVRDTARRAKNPDAKTPYLDIVEDFPATGKNVILAPYVTELNTGGVNSKSKAIFDTLSKQPEGSRGEIGVAWQMGGGHSIAYEIVKGKPVIFDTQNGKIFETVEDLAAGGYEKVKQAGFTRLDDLPLNEDFLLRWVKGA